MKIHHNFRTTITIDQTAYHITGKGETYPESGRLRYGLRVEDRNGKNILIVVACERGITVVDRIGCNVLHSSYEMRNVDVNALVQFTSNYLNRNLKKAA